ncbi:MAG: SDR family oxidoreductase [Myxococcales bacterium]|nr:MAG: SDR family oxidoreductase [Myxococcales bacterium]
MNTKSIKRLSGKLAVITGSSRGLGRATALRLASDGANIVINYKNNREAAEQVKQQVEATGSKALLVQGDLSSVAGIQSFYDQLKKELKAADLAERIDILVASAGIIHEAVIEETSEEDFDRLFNLNIKGVFFLVQKALPMMKEGGRIVTLSSGLARYSIPPYIAYAATKGAIEVLTRYLAQYLGPRGITVNCIAPGAINTDMNKERLENPQFRNAIANAAALRRIGEADDIADAIAFLVSEDSRWITAQRIEASGGAILGPPV